jgi:uncharacterized protein with ACT and thioredoxin-like domain
MTTEKLERANALRRQMDGIFENTVTLVEALRFMSEDDEKMEMYIEVETIKGDRQFGARLESNNSIDKNEFNEIVSYVIERLKMKHEAVKKEFEAL